ncbi:hypothetical protein Tco_1142342 [Tanacetum coccineum]
MTLSSTPKTCVQVSFFIIMTLDQSSSTLGPQCQMASAGISSGLALDVTPADSARPFESHPAGKTGMYFVNELRHNIHKEKIPTQTGWMKMKSTAGSNPEQSHVDLAVDKPSSLMHDDFLTTIYPKVHKSLKHTTEEHVHLENPPSSSETLSSIKNLEDNFTFSDQFINNDKSQEDEPGKTTKETILEIQGLRLYQMTSEQLGSGLKLYQMTYEQLGSGLRLHQMASEQFSSGLESQFMAPNQSSSGPALHEMTTTN